MSGVKSAQLNLMPNDTLAKSSVRKILFCVAWSLFSYICCHSLLSRMLIMLIFVPAVIVNPTCSQMPQLVSNSGQSALELLRASSLSRRCWIRTRRKHLSSSLIPLMSTWLAENKTGTGDVMYKCIYTVYIYIYEGGLKVRSHQKWCDFLRRPKCVSLLARPFTMFSP